MHLRGLVAEAEGVLGLVFAVFMFKSRAFCAMRRQWPAFPSLEDKFRIVVGLHDLSSMSLLTSLKHSCGARTVLGVNSEISAGGTQFESALCLDCFEVHMNLLLVLLLCMSMASCLLTSLMDLNGFEKQC